MTYYEPQTQKGLFGNIFLWVLGFLLIIGVIAVIGWAAGWFFAPYQGKLSARRQIVGSGAYRIAAYNHFFDLCTAIQSDQVRLQTQKDLLRTATGDDLARIQENIAGITGDLADAVNEYNNDAAKSYTLGQFRASSLPYHIDGREQVTCS